MKMTMHIDEALLERVMRSYGFASKTEAVEMALLEMDRKTRFKAVVSRGLGFSAKELKAAVDPDYDIHAMRVAEGPSSKYGKADARKRRR